jgi:galactosylceramidase
MLFTPNLGASLQMLKVEIGGDTDATEGAEPSHMHFDGDENYNRGYEWWLMKEAKKRNPDIKLYGLPWGWPGTLDSRATSMIESQDAFESVSKTANYTVSWLLGAEREHGLKIDYVGLWNEKDVPEAYTEALRDAVSRSGLKTQVLERMEHYSGSNNTPDAQGCQQYASF